ncbi:CAP domain-containing protein [Paenibacillus sp. GCM10023252]|uniref:CAP domain-containing protein n=1 Tax=Paenibacillus sp. GCM10023252 TaxID=3252649 RepID=UPI0036125C40
MNMQHIRLGVASIVAATMIGAGLTAPTAGAAPAVKTDSNVSQLIFNGDAFRELANKYGIDLNNLTFGTGIVVTWPGQGGTAPVQPEKPVKPTEPSKPTKPVQPSPTPSPTPVPTPKPTPKPTPSPTPAPTTPDVSKPSGFEAQVVDLVNVERAKAGLPALKSDAPLAKVALAKAKDMDTNNYFSHTSPTYGSPFDMMRQFGISYSYAGENIASGQRTPEEVMKAWMNSPGHRENIMSANFTKIGVGYYNGDWVQMFIG